MSVRIVRDPAIHGGSPVIEGAAETPMIPGIFGIMVTTKYDAPAVLEAPRRATPKGLASMRDHSIPTPTEDTTEEIPYGHCHCGCGQKTAIAKKTHKRSGHVRGEPTRFIRGHHARTKRAMPPNPSGLCMCGCGQVTSVARWNRSRTGDVRGEHRRFVHGHQGRKYQIGYGLDPSTGCWEWSGPVASNGYGKVFVAGEGNIGAHRWFYRRYKGEIPEGWHVHHTCANKLCVNPDHLEAVSPTDHSRIHATLTPDTVRDIRELADMGLSSYKIGAILGVAARTVRNVLAGISWEGVQ